MNTVIVRSLFGAAYVCALGASSYYGYIAYHAFIAEQQRVKYMRAEAMRLANEEWKRQDERRQMARDRRAARALEAATGHKVQPRNSSNAPGGDEP